MNSLFDQPNSISCKQDNVGSCFLFNDSRYLGIITIFYTILTSSLTSRFIFLFFKRIYSQQFDWIWTFTVWISIKIQDDQCFVKMFKSVLLEAFRVCSSFFDSNSFRLFYSVVWKESTSENSKKIRTRWVRSPSVWLQRRGQHVLFLL